MEYGLLGALIALVVLGVLSEFGQSAKMFYTMLAYIAGGDLPTLIVEHVFPQYSGDDELLQQGELYQMATDYCSDCDGLEYGDLDDLYTDWDIDKDAAFSQDEFAALIEYHKDQIPGAW